MAYERNANRPESGARHPCDQDRHLDSEASGDAARDGYTTVARRPRVPGMTESVAPDQAKSIEDMYRGFYPNDY